MITLSQKNYIQTLIDACLIRGIELPHEVIEPSKRLTKNEAAQMIDDLKFELGWRNESGER